MDYCYDWAGTVVLLLVGGWPIVMVLGVVVARVVWMEYCYDWPDAVVLLLGGGWLAVVSFGVGWCG
jgi:hypothetical protein